MTRIAWTNPEQKMKNIIMQGQPDCVCRWGDNNVVCEWQQQKVWWKYEASQRHKLLTDYNRAHFHFSRHRHALKSTEQSSYRTRYHSFLPHLMVFECNVPRWRLCAWRKCVFHCSHSNQSIPSCSSLVLFYQKCTRAQFCLLSTCVSLSLAFVLSV